MMTTRLNAPTPTRGNHPSHGPTDTRYAPGISLSRFLGYFSIGLGLAEALAPKTMSDLTGVRSQALLQAFGVREIVSGVAILSSKQPVVGLWSRVVGDVMDLATLGAAWAEADNDADRQKALIATAAVAGVTALDVINSLQMTAAASLEG